MSPMVPRHAAAALLCLPLAACGAGSDGPTRRPPERWVQVEATFRPVIDRAPAGLRRSVQYVDSATALSASPDPTRIAMVVLAGTQVPVLTEEADGVTDARAVATDQIVAVGRARGPASVAELPARAIVGFPGAPRTVADEAGTHGRGLFGQPGPGGTEPLPEHRERVLPSASAALRALRVGEIDAAMVPRSSIGHRGAGAYRRFDDRQGYVDLVYQVGTVRPTARSRRLRSWLLSDAGRAAVRSAAFSVPPPEPPEGR